MPGKFQLTLALLKPDISLNEIAVKVNKKSYTIYDKNSAL
jgi:hypothetical protein